MLQCPFRLIDDGVSLHMCTTAPASILQWLDLQVFLPWAVVNSGSTDTHVQLCLSGPHSLLSFVYLEVWLLDHGEIIVKNFFFFGEVEQCSFVVALVMQCPELVAEFSEMNLPFRGSLASVDVRLTLLP